MHKSLAIIQSNYIPWKGYFDIIDRVDLFMILDDVQFSKNTWRNRNQLKTPQGPKWLTIPVATGGRFGQAICEVEVADGSWADKHWGQWRQSYVETPGFAKFAPEIEALYRGAAEFTRLTDINVHFLKGLCRLLGITTPLVDSRDYPVEGTKTDRVVALCRAAGADHYLSGPAARDYIETDKFAAAGIELSYMSYEGYADYDQPYPPFVHAVSVIDLLFCAGDDARRLMRAG